MKIYLPTQPNQPQRWEEGLIPPLTMCQCEALATHPFRTANGDTPPAKPQGSSDQRNQIYIAFFLILFSIVSYYFISRYVVTAVVVQGRSMAPTLQDGDRYVLNRWAYYAKDPQRGDLVVLKDPGHNDYAVKRIVATPCETVYLKNESVYVNGEKLNEPYLPTGTETSVPIVKEKIIVIGREHFYVLGDNRGNSEDSRFYGAVHRSQIIGLISK